MNFNAPEFLFFFLPITLLVYHTVGPRLRIRVLLVASLIFYAWSGLLPFALMVATVVWGWLLALYQPVRQRVWLVAIAAAVPILLLWLFKYVAFTASLFGIPVSHLGPLEFFALITVPAGISFYTFKIVAYNVDVYDGRIERETSLRRLLTFISFFPPLIAGPILRYRQLAPQLRKLETDPQLKIDWREALKLFVFALAAKIFIADILRLMHERYSVATGGTQLDALFSILSYSFVIYFDFWSYSVMAIGLGRMLGVEIPRNFLEPYLSFSPKEFWRRWHVTLSFWLRDYVYLKMGGRERYVRNILIIFVLCGLWHGAGLNFIVWGAYHAALVIGYHWLQPLWDRLPKGLGIALTFALVSLGWPLFYLDLSNYLTLMGALIGTKAAVT